jgi:hypothetical protein
MRLDVTFDPNQTPERQHALNRIPPSARVAHRKLKAALVTYEQARAGELETRQTHIQAEQELPAAQFRDEQALAAATVAKKADPGPVQEEKQLALIRECRRQHGAAKILLENAVVDVVKSFASQYGEEWQAELKEERDRLRSSMAEALTEWERLHGLLQINDANRAMLSGSGTAQHKAGLFASRFTVPQVFDGSTVQVSDALAGLRSLAEPEQPNDSAIENVEVDSERRAAREREQTEVAALIAGGE